MDNYIVGIHKALEVARKLRNAGAKIKRLQKGQWEITHTPTFMEKPKVGDKILISLRHKGNDIYIIPEPDWMYKQELAKLPEYEWRLLYTGNWWITDDMLGYPPTSIS